MKKNPVLRHVKKAKKRRTNVLGTICMTSECAPICEQPVNRDSAPVIRKQLANLHAGCPPEIYTRVNHYLHSAEGPDKMLVDAWRKCGRNDKRRTLDLTLNEVARKTVSALGYACLIAYAQSWLDEYEAQAGAVTL